MPDDDLDPNDDPQPDTPPAENHDLRRLREKAKGADDATARAEAAERKLAFVQAGIDLEEPRSRYFTDGYRGDMTPDAIRSEAEAAGFLGSGHTSEPPQGITPAERAAFAGQQAAAAGSAGSEQPAEDIYKPFRDQNYRQSGESPESFGARLAQTLAANGGDVAFDGPFREFPGDTGIVPRAGTPFPKRL